MIVGVLLAAGRSRRFGSNKLLVSIGDIPIVIHSARALRYAVDRTVAVVRADDHGVHDVLAAESIHCLPCPAAEGGMGFSIACGVESSPMATGWLIALGDMPFVRPDTIIMLTQALTRGAAIAAPTYGGRQGHPVGFAHEFGQELAALSEDQGARSLIARSASRMTQIACEDPGILRDIDSPRDLFPG